MRNQIVSALVVMGAACVVHAADSRYTPPKNAYGQPNIDGVWSNATTTPFERPAQFSSRVALTEEEAAKVQGAAESYRAAGDVQHRSVCRCADRPQHQRGLQPLLDRPRHAGDARRR